MYEPHPVLLLPDDPETRIWRYMNLTKLLAILETQSLFFSSIRSFNDPYEGFIPPHTVESLRATLPKMGGTDQEVSEFAIKHREIDRDSMDFLSPRMFVNCWHINPDESAA